VAELPGLLDGKLEDTLGLRGEGQLAKGQGLGKARQRPLDLGLDRLEPQPEPLKDGGGDALSVTDQAKEDMLVPTKSWRNRPASSLARMMTRRALSVNLSNTWSPRYLGLKAPPVPLSRPEQSILQVLGVHTVFFA